MLGFVMQFIAGTWVTIEIALLALILGMLLGVVIALAGLSSFRCCRLLAIGFTTFIRGIPELLILLFIYFGATALLSKLWGDYVEINALFAGVIALGLIFAAYASEILRGAYLAIHSGQMLAAKAYGFSSIKAFIRIMLPQVWSHALPGLGNLWFVLLKDTALVALIGAPDLMRTAQNVTSYTNKPFTFYLLAAGIYLILTSISLFGQHYIEKRVNRHRYGAEHGLG